MPRGRIGQRAGSAGGSGTAGLLPIRKCRRKREPFELLDRLHLDVGDDLLDAQRGLVEPAVDQPMVIRAESKNVSLKEGAGNLPTLRIEWNLAGDLATLNSVNQVRFENKNFAERIGWNEIVLSRANGVNIFDSDAFGSGLSDELKTYPQENLAAPLVNASVRRDEAGMLAQSAMVKEESAVRLYERSRKSAEAEMERRSDANRPHRRRTMSLRLIEGGAA